MSELSIRVWGVIAVVAGIGLLSLLAAIASSIRGFTHLHDLKARVVHLRLRYLASLKQVNALQDPADIPERTDELIAFLLRPSQKPVGEATDETSAVDSPASGLRQAA